MKGCLTLIVLGCLVYFGYQYLLKKPSSKSSSKQSTHKVSRNIPKSFAAAATREGYKTDITADELVALAKKEGFTVEEIRRHIKDTPWEKSQLVSDAIERYYAKVKSEVQKEAPKVVEAVKKVPSETDIELEKARAKLTEMMLKKGSDDSEIESVGEIENFVLVQETVSDFAQKNGTYNKDNDSLFEKKDELTINFSGDKGVLIYKDREMVTIKYNVKVVNNEIVSSQYYYDGTLISSKKDAYLYLDSDKKIMKRFERYAARKGIYVDNPVLK